jgi:hypothetical protein
MAVARKAARHFAVFAGYALLATAMTWPLALRLQSHLPGRSTDTLVHYWNGWWVGHALRTGQSPFSTSLLYYPIGLRLGYHNFAWVNILAWLPLQHWVGGIAAYNLTVLASLAACGYAGFLLCREVTSSDRAALVGGLIYLCWPYRLYQLDHPNLINTQWIPLFLLFLVRALRRRRAADSLAAGLFFALAGYTRWQQLVPAAILGLIYVAVVTLRTGGFVWRPLRTLVPAFLIAAVMLAPPILALARERQVTAADLLREDEEKSMQTDLLAYVTPPQSHPVLGAWGSAAYGRYYEGRAAERRFPAYLGVTVLALVAIGAVRSKCDRRPWVLMAVALAALALGPVLRFNGRVYPGAPMPYRLAALLPFVRLMRFPDRFNMFLALPVAVLAAQGWVAVQDAIARRNQRSALAATGLVAAAVLFDYLPGPAPLQIPKLSSFYSIVAEQPGEIALLNLPISAQESKRYMFAQTTHQHPIVQGKTARFAAGTFDYLEAQPWISSLRQYGEMPPRSSDVGRQFQTLARDGVRYVVLHKTGGLKHRVNHWRDYFAFSPMFEDSELLVYRTDPQAGRDFSVISELAPGLGPISVLTNTDCLNPGGTLEFDVAWGATSAPGIDLNAEIVLVDEDGVQAQSAAKAVLEGWPTSEWQADTVARGRYSMPVSTTVPAGAYELTVALKDTGADVQIGPALGLGMVRVNQTECRFPVPSGVADVNAFFGGDLRLLGFKYEREARRIALELDWRAERLVGDDYKFYVHLFNPSTGVRAAQHDAMPRDWSYPTSFWDAGEVVSDTIMLSFEDAPPGQYALGVGVYHPQTLERRPVVDCRGAIQPGDQLVLDLPPIVVES